MLGAIKLPQRSLRFRAPAGKDRDQAFIDKELGSLAGCGAIITTRFAPAQTPVVMRSDRGGETILAVDDDDLVAELIEDVLRRKGERVLVASSPSEALAIVEQEGADISLLITDLVMPEMTGYVLADRIVAEHPHMGVIYISGYAPERVVPERRLDEDLTFLQKPFPPRDIVRAARAALDARA